jgi:hypothetical protein
LLRLIWTVSVHGGGWRVAGMCIWDISLSAYGSMLKWWRLHVLGWIKRGFTSYFFLYWLWSSPSLEARDQAMSSFNILSLLSLFTDECYCLLLLWRSILMIEPLLGVFLWSQLAKGCGGGWLGLFWPK